MKPEKKPTARKRTPINAAKVAMESKSVPPPEGRPARVRLVKNAGLTMGANAPIKPPEEQSQHEQSRKSASASERSARVKRALTVPPLLLEGDEPGAPPV